MCSNLTKYSKGRHITTCDADTNQHALLRALPVTICLGSVTVSAKPFEFMNNIYIMYPPGRLKSTLFCLWGLVHVQGLLVRILFLFCVRGVFKIFRVQPTVENCRNCQHCCAFTVVKDVKETCETAHSLPKETCDKKTRFMQHRQTACV